MKTMIRTRFFTTLSASLILLFAAGGQAAAADNDSLTWRGLTLFGSVDIGVANQTRGAEVNLDSPQGLNYTLGKASSSAMTQVAPNGLSPSTIGLKGNFGLDQDVSAIFRLEAGYNPLSLRLDNGPQSLVDNNGRTVANQTASNDSNQAGQLFNTAGYAGLQSKTYGAITFGRQAGILADRLAEYDPNGASYAFSAVAGSNTIRGFGSSEAARLDSSFKYFNQTGPFRYGAQYELSGQQYALFLPDGVSGSAVEADLGGDYRNFSTDLLYSHKNDAVVASALNAAQTLAEPTNHSLAATVSDNTAYTVLGRYKFDENKATAYAGWERIQFANPSSPLTVDSKDIGGYVLSVLTQNAYNINKVLNVYWTGAKYSLTPKLDLTGAYYRYEQNSFATGANRGCHSAVSSGCSGAFNAESFAAVYKWSSHVDVYGGFMRSAVDDGLASGYLATANLNTVVGVRVTF
jgi:predicted porin